jgi:type IV pilus assembly protein PilB
VAQAIVEEGLAPAQLALRHRLPFVSLEGVEPEQDALEQIPFHILERASALPLAIDGDRLRVAIADPGDVQTIDELRLATRFALELVVAAREEIQLELRRISRAQEVWERAALVEDDAFEVPDDGAANELEVDDGVSEAPLVRLVNSIILQAAEDAASDLHFDPHDDSFLIRERIDGVLHEVQRLPRKLGPSILTRLKVLAKLDIAERRKPQDGRMSLDARVAGRNLDIRVAILPTVEGESCVMRLVDKSKKAPTLAGTGFPDDVRSTIEEIIKRPTGALLVTGPTGSGKSTTLYAALTAMNRPEINIVTVEDPVEFRLRGVQQVQINHKAGLSFAVALRTILRSDPDVIMCGEVRDAETAKMAIESALTGHFVLSTLHTNDAPSAITRLNEMGVEPYLTASAVTAVLAQRLVRRLCTHCREPHEPSEEELLAARIDPARAGPNPVIHLRKGCPRCNQTGYRGRLGVFQLMVMTDQLERLAAARASRDDIDRAATEAGMRTLWDDGISKVLAGLTTPDELRRVLV